MILYASSSSLEFINMNDDDEDDKKKEALLIYSNDNNNNKVIKESLPSKSNDNNMLKMIEEKSFLHIIKQRVDQKKGGKNISPLITLYCGLVFHILITDMLFNVHFWPQQDIKHSKEQQDGANLLTSNKNNNHLSSSAVWASWIGELPTAAEVYGDASSEIMPSAEAFDDDDEDEELDASASNEYPDNENDNDNDENYDDAEDQQDNAESRRKERWMASPAAKVGGHAIWHDLDGWRRNKRDIEDRIVLASRRAAQKRRANENNQGEDPDFLIDDGDEDAWVHDGIDDIHIDPETKRAASELSYDEKSIDSEYEPKEQVVNRTRITTIAEVIPVSIDSDLPQQSNNNENNQQDNESTKIITHYLPASHLSIDQVQRLISKKSPNVRVASERPLSSENNNYHPSYNHYQNRDGASRAEDSYTERDF